MTTSYADRNYFDDFTVGERFRHFRGKTITDFETHTLSQLVMNTSEAHFNDETMVDSPFGTVVTFGGVVAAIVIGIASQDTAERAAGELRIESIRLLSPTRTGDTVYAESEVLESEPDGDETGVVLFKHIGINGRGDVLCEILRRVRLQRRG